MPTLLEQAKYIQTDFEENSNKIWYIYRYDDCSCKVEWCRVGDILQTKPHQFDTNDEAIAFFKMKCKEKERGKKGKDGKRLCYTKLNVLESVGSVESVSVKSSSTLKDIATKQIDTDSPDTLALIKYFTDVNVHNITEATTLTYDVQSGLFSTPAGIITKDGLDKARVILEQIGDYVEKGDLRNSAYIKLLQEYLMLIPQKVGRKLDPETLYTSTSDVQKQNDILDSLEVSLQSVLSNPTDPAMGDVPQDLQPKVFSVKLHKVTEDNVINRIKRKFKETLNHGHSSSRLGVKTVYAVEIESMKRTFEAKGKPIGNINEYWHGTKASNILSILKGGLIIPPKSAPHVCGRMFGPSSLYFSDQSTKSLNYSTGYWHGGAGTSKTFMFLADVAMGKSYIPKGPSQDLPKKGYDSTFAKGGYSGVINNEMVIYDVSQCNLTYLIEFASAGY